MYMSEKLAFNQWLLYYGDDVEEMLGNILKQIHYNNLEDKLLNYDIFYDFAKIMYNNSYKGRPLKIYR